MYMLLHITELSYGVFVFSITVSPTNHTSRHGIIQPMFKILERRRFHVGVAALLIGGALFFIIEQRKEKRC